MEWPNGVEIVTSFRDVRKRIIYSKWFSFSKVKFDSYYRQSVEGEVKDTMSMERRSSRYKSRYMA